MSICVKGYQFVLGSYATEKTAAQVYDNAVYYLAAAGFLKQSSLLNFPDDYFHQDRPAPFLRTGQLLARLRLRKAIQSNA